MGEVKIKFGKKKMCICIGAVAVLLLLINLFRDINIKDKIDESSTVSVYFVEEEAFGDTETDYMVFEVGDYKFAELSSLLKGSMYKKNFVQDASQYSHEKKAISFTIKFYDDDENEKLSMTLYSDGVCIIDGTYADTSSKIYEQVYSVIYLK